MTRYCGAGEYIDNYWVIGGEYVDFLPRYCLHSLCPTKRNQHPKHDPGQGVGSHNLGIEITFLNFLKHSIMLNQVDKPQTAKMRLFLIRRTQKQKKPLRRFGS